MTEYSNAYDPPAPATSITIRNPEIPELICDVPMLLDTGSDLTLVPRRFCEMIEVKESTTDFLELESFNRVTSVAYYVRVDLIFLNTLFRGNFLAYDHSEGIIGRDILNEFSILLDGPKLNWKENKQ